jgi:hypothetical protein
MPPQVLLAKKILDDAVLGGLSSAQSLFEKQVVSNNYNFAANRKLRANHHRIPKFQINQHFLSPFKSKHALVRVLAR